MSKDMHDRAEELDIEFNGWVKVAFNEILSHIYSCE